MVTFDMDPCLTEVAKIALSLSATFLRHSLQGNVGPPCLLMLLLFLEFILISLKLTKKTKTKKAEKNINKLITFVYLILSGQWLK